MKNPEYSHISRRTYLSFRLAYIAGSFIGLLLTMCSLVIYLIIVNNIQKETDRFLAGIAHLVVISARNAPQQNRDQAVTDTVNQIGSALDVADINRNNLPRQIRTESLFINTSKVYIRVLASDKNALIATNRLMNTGDYQAVFNKPLKNILNTSRYQYFTNDYPEINRFRIVTRMVDLGDGYIIYIQAGMPISYQDSLLNYLIDIMIVTIVSGMILTILGVILIVRRSLQSINRIIDDVEKYRYEDKSSYNIRYYEADQEIIHLVSTFNILIQRLTESITIEKRITRAQNQFIQNAVHQLQTPVTVMRLQLENTLRQPRSIDDYHNTINKCLSELSRTTALISEMAALERYDSRDSSTGNYIPVNLPPLIYDVVDSLQNVADDKQIDIVTDIYNGDLFVNGRSDDLLQAIANIMDNAIKYTRNGGEIIVKLDIIDEDYALIAIADNGYGISEEELPFLFNRFWRSPNASGISGTGLGLSICEQIIKSHDGEINVQSKLGKGSTFSIKLPIHK